MEGSSTTSLAAATDDGPESWEALDVEASMRRLLLSSTKETKDEPFAIAAPDSDVPVTNALKSSSISDDLISTVDQFLREAIQNSRERVSVLRLEQDVEMFIRDPMREVMEFQQLPTSYLRLAAHRVAQHYSLQSMVLMDNNMSDSSGSRIIVQKTSNIKLPAIRLADIPVNLPNEESGAIKVAIKQRQQKGSQGNATSSSHPVRANSLKSVEERKEEYNRARARIFNSNNATGGSSAKKENDSRNQDSTPRSSVVKKKADGIAISCASNMPSTTTMSEFSSTSKFPGRQTEKESAGRPKTNNRVAIFRDHEVDRKDPDYSRTYDRYMQRFDPGFGFSPAPYNIQPLYAPVYNYNSEFPQLGSNHRPPISSEHQHQPQPLPHHLPGAWVSPSAPRGIMYGTSESMLPPYTSGHINAHSNSGVYLNSAQYSSQQTVMPPYVHHIDPSHRPFTQSNQAQTDMSFGLARPR